MQEVSEVSDSKFLMVLLFTAVGFDCCFDHLSDGNPYILEKYHFYFIVLSIASGITSGVVKNKQLKPLNGQEQIDKHDRIVKNIKNSILSFSDLIQVYF